ncbi:MAG: RdgB/HAM1 family non-canonical purine NTP pyrophosphatase [Chloroherpetonaceae bacterium]|nr:RdgB/HAM1 family non-canonical purine NTP pyrophosphatase [Chloroherpetonaceae bacterium]MDW8437001.1 RdgB/HAM1 family non-canonical purine NTP pyrophosphatase [Chloroherpetonaceae bacterium]
MSHVALVLATRNRDKIKEIERALRELPSVQLLSLDDLPDMPDVEEDAPTLEGNALKKAREVRRFAASRFPQALALADDTGLEVEALGGAPGVYSARYAQSELGRKPTYAENVAKLLRNLRGETNRKARFRTVIALVGRWNDSDIETVFEGVAEGEILAEPRGEGGFGYDPVFFSLEAKKTFAELSLDEKNAISHRGKALKAVAAFLRRLCA